MDYIFVYGTLMRGMENFRLIAPFAASVEAAEADGALYHLPYGYPALAPGGAGTVRGEAVRARDMAAALAVLDELEDYRGPGDPANLYERVVVAVRLTSGGEVAAYVYVWARPEELAAIGVPVPGGCWRAFMAGQRRE